MARARTTRRFLLLGVVLGFTLGALGLTVQSATTARSGLPHAIVTSTHDTTVATSATHSERSPRLLLPGAATMLLGLALLVALRTRRHTNARAGLNPGLSLRRRGPPAHLCLSY